jgi:GNAT superfamily N-acetyltransferase
MITPPAGFHTDSTEQGLAMLRIRQGIPEDAPTLSELAFRSKAFWGYSPEFMEACHRELTYNETDFPSYYFAVAEDPQLVGFYCLGFLTDTETQLHSLFVDPDFMGQGYGRALLNHAKIQARVFGSKSILIVSDPHAVDFFRAQHAVICGEKASPVFGGRMLPLLTLEIDKTL